MIIAVVSALAAAAVLIFSLYAYCTAFYSPPKKRSAPTSMPNNEKYAAANERIAALTQELGSLSCEEITASAYDGISLHARYYHVCDNAPIQIQFHGYRSTAINDFCGGCLLARRMGHNVLLVDQRACGKSGSSTITFGIRERKDCMTWVDYVCKRFGADTQILLVGISMGAATVLMASDMGLPKNVACIIADSAYSSPESIIRKVITDMRLPSRLAFPFVRLGALIFGGLRIQGGAVDSVKRTDIPVLLIHGEADSFVPCDMSREIYEVCRSHKRLETFPDAEHGLSYMTDTERYKQTIYEFLQVCGISAKHPDN